MTAQPQIKRIEVPVKTNKVFRLLENSDKRVRSLRGGTRSGKTYNILKWLVMLYMREKGNTLTIARQTMPALKASAMRDFFEILDDLGLYDEKYHNKTNNEYELNGNLIEFIGLSEEARIRGRKRTDVFINEVNETTLDAWRQLSFRTSRFIIQDYNPSDPYSWVYDDVESRPDCDLFVTTYKDNPFLEPTLVQEIEMLQEADPEYWTVYGLGEIGRGGTRIFPHWQECEGARWPYNKGQTVFGVDFGFNNPSAVVEVTDYDNGLYWRELMYERGLTNSDLVTRLKGIPELKGQILVCDNAEPDKIEDLKRAGLRAIPAFKAIKETIDFVKSRRLYVHPLSENIKREIKKYSWKTDTKTGLLMDEVVKFDDHAMDAGRYGSYHFHKGKARFGSQ
jgi:phage terminase large subunit